MKAHDMCRRMALAWSVSLKAQLSALSFLSRPQLDVPLDIPSWARPFKHARPPRRRAETFKNTLKF